MNQKRIEQIGESLQSLPEEGHRWTSPLGWFRFIGSPLYLVTVIVHSNLVITGMLIVLPLLFTNASRGNPLQKFPVKSPQNLLTFCITAVTIWVWDSAQVDLGQE